MEQVSEVGRGNSSTLERRLPLPLPPTTTCPILGDSEQGAVSVGSPSQAAAEGALMQWRDLNFLQLDEEGSHSDHSPHSAQVPVVVVVVVDVEVVVVVVVITGHSAELQSSTSVESPEHCSLPPDSG